MKLVSIVILAKYASDIKSRIVAAKASLNKQETLFVRKLDFSLRKKLMKFYVWSTDIYGAENWVLRTADQKYLGDFKMRCWRRMEKIVWTDRVRNVVL